MSFESFEVFEYSVFYYFFYPSGRYIVLKSNEKEKEKLCPLIRLIKHEKLRIPLAPRWPNRNGKKIKFIGFVGRKITAGNLGRINWFYCKKFLLNDFPDTSRVTYNNFLPPLKNYRGFKIPSLFVCSK